MAALPVVLRVGWFRRGCGVGGDAGVAGHHGCVQKITEDAMRPLAEFTPFDGNRLLGLDVLDLRGAAQRHVMRGGRGGVWQVVCAPQPGRGPRAPGLRRAGPGQELVVAWFRAHAGGQVGRAPAGAVQAL